MVTLIIVLAAIIVFSIVARILALIGWIFGLLLPVAGIIVLCLLIFVVFNKNKNSR